MKRFRDQAAAEKDPKTKHPLGENNIIRRLVWMYGHHIPWNWESKEALLYAETSAGPDMIGKGSSKFRRHRINVGLIGGAGLLKSTLARCVILHDERNKYETAQGMTGKTMTAIVSKEGGDNSIPVLRTGALAHAKEAVLAVNEFAELSLDEQKHFQDAWEEGQFTINKMGIRATIRADSVGIWTGNPKQAASFSNIRRISLDEINVRKQILDRTDLLIVIKAIEDDQQLQLFNDLMLEPETATPERKKIIFNYDQYVKLHIMYSKRINPTLSPEAKQIINESDRRIQRQKRLDDVPNAGSHRGLGILLRLATVIAKLKLHQEITAEDANYAVEYYNKVSNDIQTSVTVPQDPAELAKNTMLYILQNESNGLSITLRDMAERASARDAAIKWYLYQGTKNKLGDVSTNRALRRVLELLENVSSSKVQRVKMQPAEFLWIRKDDDESEVEDNSEDSGHADIADVADRGNLPHTVDKGDVSLSAAADDDREPTNQLTLQTEQPKKGASATSVTSAIEGKKVVEKPSPPPPPEGKYKILKCMEQAAVSYSEAKGTLQESSSLFNRFDLWYHISAAFPNRTLDIHKVDAIIKDQVRKGRVLLRQEDGPDRYYLVWRDDAAATAGAS